MTRNGQSHSKWSDIKRRLGARVVPALTTRIAFFHDMSGDHSACPICNAIGDPREINRLAVEALIDAHYYNYEAADELQWLSNHDELADALVLALSLKLGNNPTVGHFARREDEIAQIAAVLPEHGTPECTAHHSCTAYAEALYERGVRASVSA